MDPANVSVAYVRWWETALHRWKTRTVTTDLIPTDRRPYRIVFPNHNFHSAGSITG